MTAWLRFAGLAVPALVVVAEAACRWWIRRRSRYYVWPPGMRLEIRLAPAVFPQLEPRVRFDINADGERGSEVPREKNGLYRVLATGGSAVECFALDQPKSWPGVLERLLNAADSLQSLGARHVHVGNIGHSGVGSADLDLILERVLPQYRRLDVILIMVGASDVYHWLEEGAPSSRPPSAVPEQWLFGSHPRQRFGWKPGAWAVLEVARRLRRSWLRPLEVKERAGAWYAAARRMRAEATEMRETMPDATVTVNNFEEHFRRVCRRAIAHADRVLVMLQPWFEGDYTPQEAAWFWHGGVGRPWTETVTAYYGLEVVNRLLDLVHARAAQVVDELGIQRLNLRRVLTQRGRHYFDHDHYTAAGAEVVARAVASAILERPASAGRSRVTRLDATHDRDQVFAPCYPGLTPRMLLPTARAASVPFPFNDPHARYFYLARNAVYALARLWKLQDKEVLFPAYFHGVELDALLHAGVRVRFYPVSQGMRVRVDDVVSRIGEDTRAIYLTHYVGFPGPVEELAQVTRDRGLRLIEDCALSLLSCFGDRPLGSWGDAAIFCLYKSLPVPNGGVLVLRNGERSALPDGDLPSLASTLALSADAFERHLQIHGPRWQRGVLNAVRAAGRRAAHLFGGARVDVDTEHFEQAYAPLAMSKLSHQIIGAQDFPTIVDARRRNYLQLLDSLRDIAPPVFDTLPTGVCPLFYPLRVGNKAAVAGQFLACGVDAVNVWSRNHPGGPVEPYPEVDELRRTVLELPCHQDLTPQVIERVVRVAKDVLP